MKSIVPEAMLKHEGAVMRKMKQANFDIQTDKLLGNSLHARIVKYSFYLLKPCARNFFNEIVLLHYTGVKNLRIQDRFLPGY